MEMPRRKPNRIAGYDYSQSGAYFVTICTQDRKKILSKISVGTPLPGCPEMVCDNNGHPGTGVPTVELLWHGEIADKYIRQMDVFYEHLSVDQYVIMPNHIHVILVIENPSAIHSISQIIALYKTGVTKQIRGLYPNLQVWQRSFYDHIIRNQRSYEEIWTYVDDNPQKWEADKFYVDLGRVENPPLQE